MSEARSAETPRKRIRGALYVIAMDIEDPNDATDSAGREATMRALVGALHALSGSGATHGKQIDIVRTNIMQYQVTKEVPDHGRTGS